MYTRIEDGIFATDIICGIVVFIVVILILNYNCNILKINSCEVKNGTNRPNLSFENCPFI